MKTSGEYENPDGSKGGPQWECSPGTCKLMIVFIPKLHHIQEKERERIRISTKFQIEQDRLDKLIHNIFLDDDVCVGTSHGEDTVCYPVSKHQSIFNTLVIFMLIENSLCLHYIVYNKAGLLLSCAKIYKTIEYKLNTLNTEKKKKMPVQLLLSWPTKTRQDYLGD